MQAAARLAATAAAQRCGLLAAGQHSTLPALTFQVTNLTSLAGLAGRAGGIDRQQGSGGSGDTVASRQQQLPTAAQQPWQQQLLLPGTAAWAAAQQQRPIFNFAGLGGDISKKYHEKKLLGWTPRQVYDVVAAVEHYHQFVPWCQRSNVLLRRPPGYLEAELEVGFQMFVERYTSKVTLQCPSAVHSRVDNSTLFSHLTNKWEFRLGPTPHTTWLSFEVDFAFKSPLYRHVASVFFEEVVQRMMGAFEGRCAHLYGPSSLQRRPGPAQHAAASGR
ncbi:hypothetical protein ABPG75_011611 [Micractinium tetrahymenae]